MRTRQAVFSSLARERESLPAPLRSRLVQCDSLIGFMSEGGSSLLWWLLAHCGRICLQIVRGYGLLAVRMASGSPKCATGFMMANPAHKGGGCILVVGHRGLGLRPSSIIAFSSLPPSILVHSVNRHFSPAAIPGPCDQHLGVHSCPW